MIGFGWGSTGQGFATRRAVGWVLLGMALSFATFSAATEPPAHPRLTHATRRWMARAGLIFSGRVISLRTLVPTQSGGVPLVEIMFHVEHSVRGTKPGQTLVIKEWAGGWMTQGHPEYRLGERVFVLLYPPNRAGITSELGGRGVLRLDQDGTLGLPTDWLGDGGAGGGTGGDASDDNSDTPLPGPAGPYANGGPTASGTGGVIRHMTAAHLARSLRYELSRLGVHP